MARGQHRFWTTRNTRGRAMRAAIRADNAPVKQDERDRRDIRVKAKIKALVDAKTPLSGECLSWLSRRTGRPAGKLSAADIQSAIA
jgi:hypothetical protein